MFDRFTDRARRSVVLAQDEARALGHRQVDVHHMLAGLAREGEGVAAQALARLQADGRALRAAVVKLTPPESGPLPATLSLPFTPRLKKALELALREAIILGHNYVATEHLLLGLMRECEADGSPCAEALAAVNVKPEDVRESVIRLLDGYEQARVSAEPAVPASGTAARLARLLAGVTDEDLAAAYRALTPDKRERLRKALGITR